MRSRSAAWFVAQTRAIGYAIVALCLPAASAFGAGHEYTICSGEFALCAASTCQPTGGSITVNVTSGGTASFPEADCTCPVLSGSALADLAGGNMHGSCTPPSGQVWSLYQARSEIPQAVADWKSIPAPVQICPASFGQGNQQVNCGSFACDPAGEINGVPVATCHCALGESLNGTPVPADTAFPTQTGQADRTFCYQHPVGIAVTDAGGGIQGEAATAACYENAPHDGSRSVSGAYRNTPYAIVRTQFDADSGTKPEACGLTSAIRIPGNRP